MKRSRSFPIFYRYIVREIFLPFLLTLFVFTGILFLARSLQLIDMVINKNVSLGDIIIIFSLIIPKFLELAIPMALLISIVMAFGRLSADSEIVVMRATGLSFGRLARPVLAFAAATFLLTIIIGFWLTPWANYRLGLGMFEIAKMQASTGLIPGVFNELGNLIIYAEKVEGKSGHLQNIIIADRRDANLNRNFIAKYGQLVSDERSRTLLLRLYNGSISEGSGLDYNITYFEINNITLPHSELMPENRGSGDKSADEMSIGELRSAITTMDQKKETLDEEAKIDLSRYTVEFHRRLALPLACFCVSFIAMALGIQPSRGSSTWGSAANMVLGISVILGYYLLFTLGTAFSRQALGPAWLLMWIPNVIVAIIAVFLFKRLGEEHRTAVRDFVSRCVGWICEKLELTRCASN